MKKLILIGILYPFLSFAQVNVVKKPTILLELKRVSWLADLSYEVVNNDTLYTFGFRNNKSTMTYSIHFSDMDEIKDFGKGFAAALKSEKGDKVILKQCAIIKDRTLGIVEYDLFKDGGYGSFSTKQAQKITEVIAKL